MTQLAFSIRTTASCKTVHLMGSWDGYAGQLPLSHDRSKKDAWTGTFRFNPSVIKPGQRYWYYYVIDGYQAAHDPARDSIFEPKSGRRLNILISKKGTETSSIQKNTTSEASSCHHSSRQRRNGPIDLPKGRPLSPSKIVAPRPIKPEAVASPSVVSRVSAESVSEHGSATVANLACQLEHARIRGEEPVDWDEWNGSLSGASDSEDEEIISDSDASVSQRSISSNSSGALSLASSRSSNASTPLHAIAPRRRPPATVSRCVCNRFVRNRAGATVRVDCLGAKCGGRPEPESDCSDIDIGSDCDSRRGGYRVGSGNECDDEESSDDESIVSDDGA